MKTRQIVAPAILLITASILLVRLPLAIAERSSDYTVLNPVVDVYHLVNRHFLKETDPEKLQQGAIQGMLEALDDPYTEYIATENLADFDKQIRGEYVGIGASVQDQDGWLLIVSPLEDSPAYKAGIEAEDLVVAINGESVWNKGVNSIIDELMGEPGSNVRVTVQREGTRMDIPANALPPSIPGESGEAPGPAPGTVRFDLNITRDRIVTSTIKGIHRHGDQWDYMVDPVRKIGYVRVTQFTSSTVPELQTALQTLLESDMRGLILDLRFNRGGSMWAAIEMSDLFLDEGLIVSARGRTGSESREYAQTEGTLPDFPMIVMINGSSASASEIVAGALADNDRAVILGERSFGKGVVQSLYRLPSGDGQLKITEQYYYLPSGRLLHREDDSTEWGVDPTPGFYIPMDNDEYRQMLRIRREEEVIRNGRDLADTESRWADPEWILEYLKDKQLSAAVRAVNVRLEQGDWQPVGELAPEGTLQAAEYQRLERSYELILRELERVERRLAALEDAADAAETSVDPIPGDDDLTDGRLDIYGADGKLITSLRITGATFERWLIDAPVEPIEPDATPQ